MIGKTISHYRILEKLGAGGMGVVYRARDTKLDRTVALKFLPPEMTRDHRAKARFVHEAKAAAALAHPNICTIYEIDEAEQQLFIAMECIEGQSLNEKISEGPMKLDEAIGIAIQVAEGLQEAHEKGIVHRDIKPANVMVTDEGRVKIMDFGLATSAVATRVTKAGTTLGTAAYMSPEQARGMEVDHRTDIWSLGVVLSEMVTGQLPFKGDREQAVVYSILNEDPEPLADLREGAPPELERIVKRALAKDRGARYSDVGEFLKDLMEHPSRLGAPATPTTGIARLLQSFRRPNVVVPAVLIILVLGLVLGWQIRRAAKSRWAREVAIPEIERLVDQAVLEVSWDRYQEAFALAKQAARYIPADSTLLGIWDDCSSRITVLTEPAGANIFIKEYRALDSGWEFIGVTPLDSIRLPKSFLRWRIEKAGYDTLVAVVPSYEDTLFRVLDSAGTVPAGMVHVPGQMLDDEYLPEFFIDRYEVSNEQYKAFVKSGGYQKQEYWQHEFMKAGKVLTWEEAMAGFKDATGRPGPSTWRAGDYPDGQADYPVSGVSWYEAAAFAACVGKDLPTALQGEVAAGSSC
jgi:tRNA A-37 threonylcarbamoyl transferase component Bud32